MQGQTSKNTNSKRKLKYKRKTVSVHDPSIIKCENEYYVFGTHMTGAFSKDLQKWKYIGKGYNENNPIYENLFDEKIGAFEYAGRNANGTYSVWAPDVIYNKKRKKYAMYFCTTTSFVKSSICFAEAENIKGPYKWKQNLLYSGFENYNLPHTNVGDTTDNNKAMFRYCNEDGSYNYYEWPNAMDPCVFYDEDEKLKMVYGSWSGGIFLLEIDEDSGTIIHPKEIYNKEKLISDAYFGYKLLGGGHHSIEGPYIYFDKETRYYFLFVSYGKLKREGGYQIRVFRSKKVLGPYLDMNGKSLTSEEDHEKYGLKLCGNYKLHDNEMAYMSPGHNSVLEDMDGKRYIVFHTRFENSSENHEIRVQQFTLNEDGWPCMFPYYTQGEDLEKNRVQDAEIQGKYEVLLHGISINSKIPELEYIELLEDHSICKIKKEGKENKIGEWNCLENTCYIQIIYDFVTYKGIVGKMKNESKEPILFFSAVGANKSIWGIKQERI